MKATSILLVLLSGVLLTGSGCKSARPAVPANLTKQAQLPGLPGVRLVLDPMTTQSTEVDALLQPVVERVRSKSGALKLLALSGGGAFGAYGAGVLNGWTTTGTRPEFDIVAGISTGSLIAPYAFLGTNYDAQLKRLFTTVTDKDIFTRRSYFSILTGADSVADTAPLHRSLLKNIDDNMLAAIAAEHRKGRRLYAGTSDLNAEVLMAWDLGAIAASGHPQAREFFCRVLLASASIPVAFPPVFFEVEADGHRYEEMHADGGCMTQVFGFAFLTRLMQLSGRTDGQMFVLRNQSLAEKWQETHPGILSLAGRSIAMLVRSQGMADLYLAYLAATEAGAEFNLAYVPNDFQFANPKGKFDPKFMTALFQSGYDQARNGTAWAKQPPALNLVKPGK